MAKTTFGSTMPSSFVEDLAYDMQNPYRISVKRFAADEMTILHYADSVEILIADGLKGEVVINDIRFTLGGQQVFVIPQNIVHRTIIEKCGGTLYVLKLHMRSLQSLLNVEALTDGRLLNEVDYTCDRFDALKADVLQLIDSDSLFEQLRILLSVIEILHTGSRRKYADSEFSNTNIILRKVIDWTTEKYGTHISIQDVADYIGYSKFHFVRWFKQTTGITYYTYLSHIRIENAKRMLMQKEDVNSVAHACGYENVSHFIAMFRKYVDCTPGEYVRSFDDRPSMLTAEY